MTFSAPAPPAGSPGVGRGQGESEADAEFLTALAVEFDAVEAALRRLDTPAAGKCEVCGADIAKSDLASDPLRCRCDTHLD